jgi:hypothetical protein
VLSIAVEDLLVKNLSTVRRWSEMNMETEQQIFV